jgi:hypothetical protein
MSLQLVVTFQVHRHLHVRVWNNVIRKLKLVHKEQESIVQDGMKPVLMSILTLKAGWMSMAMAFWLFSVSTTIDGYPSWICMKSILLWFSKVPGPPAPARNAFFRLIRSIAITSFVNKKFWITIDRPIDSVACERPR